MDMREIVRRRAPLRVRVAGSLSRPILWFLARRHDATGSRQFTLDLLASSDVEKRALVPSRTLVVRVLHTCLAPSLRGRVEGVVEELALEAVSAAALDEAEAHLLLFALRIVPEVLKRAVVTKHALPVGVVDAFVW